MAGTMPITWKRGERWSSVTRVSEAMAMDWSLHSGLYDCGPWGDGGEGRVKVELSTSMNWQSWRWQGGRRARRWSLFGINSTKKKIKLE